MRAVYRHFGCDGVPEHLIVIVSMTLGAAVGALLNIDGAIHRLGTWVEAHVHRTRAAVAG